MKHHLSGSCLTNNYMDFKAGESRSLVFVSENPEERTPVTQIWLFQVEYIEHAPCAKARVYLCNHVSNSKSNM